MGGQWAGTAVSGAGKIVRARSNGEYQVQILVSEGEK